MDGADLFAAAVVITFYACIGLVTGALAKRKGYAFGLWFFAGGVIGLIALSTLPFANTPELPNWERNTRIEKANSIAQKILIFKFAVVLIRLGTL